MYEQFAALHRLFLFNTLEPLRCKLLRFLLYPFSKQ